jgi:hypothetical protein
LASGCVGGQPAPASELEPPDPPEPVLVPPDPAVEPPEVDPLAPALPLVAIVVPELSSPPQLAPTTAKTTNDPTSALRAFRIAILPA